MELTIDTVAVGRCAGAMERAGDDLDDVRARLDDGTVSDDVFGALGAETGAVAAYRGTAEALRERLVAGSAALRAAAETLHEVARRYLDADDAMAADVAGAVRTVQVGRR
ncbi:hypothetical protein SAMN05421810_1115 [Amycolatopsis arida]|uniref:Excreted virulence factor EspC, type VII ESX diderm n=1 Tax=Amycolatopsis arida TaxID=587909 RepID=A0A1I6A1T2_9PSEU|nr:hypothetical protein [Amycolatopsis arida]TDX88686.1 hypothetical protein CLV69_111208 [Amycolatopsis arida]SFQ62681.1 hypothetical protein SAMN05421810_1115 [Amycolatopsis arida]